MRHHATGLPPHNGKSRPEGKTSVRLHVPNLAVWANLDSTEAATLCRSHHSCIRSSPAFEASPPRNQFARTLIPVWRCAMTDTAMHRRLTSASRLLESENAGERGAALNAMQRMLAAQGKSVADVIIEGLKPAAIPSQTQSRPRATLLKPWQRKAWLLLVSGEKWDTRSRDFLESMRLRNAALSAKQAAYLDDLHSRAERNRSNA